jgi:hypothetical protein
MTGSDRTFATITPQKPNFNTAKWSGHALIGKPAKRHESEAGSGWTTEFHDWGE